MNTVERIESLRREIEQKKIKLGISNELLTMKSLKKYANINALTFSKSVERNNILYSDLNKRLSNIRYKDYKNVGRLRHVKGKIIGEFKKKIFSDIATITENQSYDNSILAINQYIKENFPKSTLYIVSAQDAPESAITITKNVYSKYEKVSVQNIVKVVIPHRTETFFSSYDVLMKGRGVGRFKNNQTVQHITDFMSLLASHVVTSIVYDYLSQDTSNLSLSIQKIQKYIEFDLDEFNSQIFEVLEEIMDNKCSSFDFTDSVIALTMETLLQDSFNILEYEKRLKDLSGSYAKTYMTKKNIPKKIQSFMDDNYFLNMFDFVEADEQCDLEKLEALANEFVWLSNQLFLPKAKKHSLRFRRLGKLKAGGVYYPGFNTLAVDIDSVESFVHEFFHFIDFDNKILSLNNEFKPLLELYINSIEDSLKELGEEHPVWKAMNSKNKYSKTYFYSNEEAFARMGEIYVSKILGIQSSFNSMDYENDYNAIVYPQNPELMKLIKEYYTKLFTDLKETKEPVQVQFY